MVNTFYFVVIAVLLIVVIQKLYKKPIKPIKPIKVDEEIDEPKLIKIEVNESKTVEVEIDEPKIIEAEINESKAVKAKIKEPLKAQIPTKNKWLYPSDHFGKMQEGVVDNSKTYKTYIHKNEEDYDFIIKKVDGVEKTTDS